jgi:tetratricopeptide (TPR) repeat protein
MRSARLRHWTCSLAASALSGSAATSAAAAEIARACAGLPLAISIAAARAAGRPGVTLAALARELTDSRHLLDALSTGDAGTSPRAVFSWSYLLLGPVTARFFRLLGLHQGPDISVAAAACLGGVAAGTARHLLAELTDANLLAAPEPDRFGFHDLLRAYATERVLEQEPEADRAAAVRRLLGWYLRTAVAAARMVEPRRRHVSVDPPETMCEALSFGSYDEALRWLEAERANLVAAVTTANELGAHDIAWKLPIELWDLFNLRGYAADWIGSVETGLASARQIRDQAAEAWLLNHLAMAYQQSGDSARAIACFQESLAIRRRVGDRYGQAAVLANLGRTYSEGGRLAESMDYLQQALAVFRETGQRPAQGRALAAISATCRRLGRFEEAVHSARQALVIISELGEPREESGR